MATTPAVVPSPSRSFVPWSKRTRSRLLVVLRPAASAAARSWWMPRCAQKSTMMTTMLLSTGASIGAANFRLALSKAVPIVINPYTAT